MFTNYSILSGLTIYIKNTKLYLNYIVAYDIYSYGTVNYYVSKGMDLIWHTISNRVGWMVFFCVLFCFTQKNINFFRVFFCCYLRNFRLIESNRFLGFKKILETFITYLRFIINIQLFRYKIPFLIFISLLTFAKLN